MDGMFRLTDPERKIALRWVHHGGDHRVARRAHVLLLLADGHTVRTIVAMLFCSFDLIASVRREYRCQGFDAALGTERGIERTPGWWGWLLGWVLKRTPWDFGISRSRWSCESLAKVIRQKLGRQLGRESVRLILVQLGLVWRRPRSRRRSGRSTPSTTRKCVRSSSCRRLAAGPRGRLPRRSADRPKPEDRFPVDASWVPGRGRDTRGQ